MRAECCTHPNLGCLVRNHIRGCTCFRVLPQSFLFRLRYNIVHNYAATSQLCTVDSIYTFVMQRVRHRCLSMELEDSFGVLNGKRAIKSMKSFVPPPGTPPLVKRPSTVVVTTFTFEHELVQPTGYAMKTKSFKAKHD